MVVLLSDAATRLGDAGDLVCYHCRALGEQLVELLHRHAGGLAQHPHRRAGALLEVLATHELDDAPVMLRELIDAFGRGELRGHGLGPLVRIGEEALVVAIDVDASDGCGGHGHSSFGAGGRLPDVGIVELRPGRSRPGRRLCQYTDWNSSLPRWFSR